MWLLFYTAAEKKKLLYNNYTHLYQESQQTRPALNWEGYIYIVTEPWHIIHLKKNKVYFRTLQTPNI